ncbi:MAG TPA: hypothetical protein DFR83_10585 [Deltaproteobacteria bacterium]|nr:hypothetical protein [Deltaproteobacteria bacterium]
MKRVIVLFELCACAPPTSPPALTPHLLTHLEQPERPAIIAHRGGAALGPEETVETMQRSITGGATVLELDVHLTRDGIPVLLHDATVDRTTSGTGSVVDLTFSEVQSLNAGEGTTIPHLVDPLRAFPDIPFILELKGSHPDLVPTVVDVLRDEDALSRVILASFHTDRLEAARAIDEAPATGLSTAEVLEWLWYEEHDTYRPPAAFAQIPPQVPGLELVTPARIERARQLGLSIQVWTINDPGEARLLADMGVAGILTDAPDRIHAALTQSVPPPVGP